MKICILRQRYLRHENLLAINHPHGRQDKKIHVLQFIITENLVGVLLFTQIP